MPIFLDIENLPSNIRSFKLTNITPLNIIKLANKLNNVHTLILKISSFDNYEKSELIKFLTKEMPNFT